MPKGSFSSFQSTARTMGTISSGIAASRASGGNYRGAASTSQQATACHIIGGNPLGVATSMGMTSHYNEHANQSSSAHSSSSHHAPSAPKTPAIQPQVPSSVLTAAAPQPAPVIVPVPVEKPIIAPVSLQSVATSRPAQDPQKASPDTFFTPKQQPAINDRSDEDKPKGWFCCC